MSPASINMAETLSTLRFADQAKRIKNQVGRQQDVVKRGIETNQLGSKLFLSAAAVQTCFLCRRW